MGSDENLEKDILEVIRSLHFTNGIGLNYPSPEDIYKRLVSIEPDVKIEDVGKTIKKLEKDGKIKRAPHYYVSV